MSRIMTAALILVAAIAAEAKATPVDLDKPGALEALEKDRPAHYKKVMREISKAQAIHVDSKPSVQKADTGERDPRQKGATILLPSDPAKKRLTITVEDVVYRVTAYMTEHPAKMEQAR